jgi:hypothetical protein
VSAAIRAKKNIFSLRTGIIVPLSRSAPTIAFKELATQTEVITLSPNEELIRGLSAPVLCRQAGPNRPFRLLPMRYLARDIQQCGAVFSAL